MDFRAARPHFTRRRIGAFLVVLAVAAVALPIAIPQIAARSAEARTAEEAMEIGDALVKVFTQSGTFPQDVVADNTDGNHPDVVADGRPIPGLTLARNMAIYYYSAESRDLGIGFCLEHRSDAGEPNAFAVYGAVGELGAGDVSETGHGNGCRSAQ